MPFKWKIFKASLYAGLILTVCCFAGWTAFYIRIHPVFTIGAYGISLFVALLVTILNTFFLFWILKKKFPEGIITNSIEGMVYLFSILLFVACLYMAFYGPLYLKAVISYAGRPDNWIILEKWLAIATMALSALYIYIGINAFLLIKTISRNRLETIQKVANLGK